MSETIASPRVADDVVMPTSADAVACDVRDISHLDDLEAASTLFRSIWARSDNSDLVPVEMLRALSHAGNQISGAFVDGELVGALTGFLGLHDGEMLLHSHVMGFHPSVRSRGMGKALKLHQREWALSRDIDTITWTFDPLVRRNAYFNLHKLGAVGAEYHVDFYGRMGDRVNGSDPSDRLVALWDLRGARAVHAVDAPPATSPQALEAATIILDMDERGAPLVTGAAFGPSCRVRIPDDIEAIRAANPELARQWRHAVRESLGRAVQHGWQAQDATRDGWYVLTKPSHQQQ